MEKNFCKKAGDIMKNLLLFLGFIFILLFMAELGLRIIDYPAYGYTKGMFQADEIMGYRLSPNFSGKQYIEGIFTINSNSQGLRDFREYNYEKGNKSRILILGDCFSFGNGEPLEETYPELLRQDFNEEVEIINTGLMGYGLNNEYLYFINEGIKYNPDVILLQFSATDWGNHKIIEKNGKELIDKTQSLTTDKNGILITNKKAGLPTRINFFFMTHSRVYNFVYARLRPLIFKFKKEHKENPLLIYMPKDSSEYREAYYGYHNLLKKLKESTNAKVILLLGPNSLYLFTPEQLKNKYGISYPIKANQVEESIEDLAKDLGIEVIKIQSDDPKFLTAKTGHWALEGSKIIAKELHLKLNQRLSEIRSTSSFNASI